MTVLIAMTITVNDKLSKIVHAYKLNKEKQKRLYLFSVMNLFLILLSTGCLSPLLTAVNKNNTKEAETLINNGADVNKKSLGATPLYTAVYRNNPEIVRLLFDKGAESSMCSQGDAIHNKNKGRYRYYNCSSR